MMNLPKGFVLDEPEKSDSAMALPPGFVLDQGGEIATVPAAPAKPGMLSNLNESLVKRGVNIADALTRPQPADYLDRVKQQAETALQVTGQTAGLIGDVVGNVVSGVIPDKVKEVGGDLLKKTFQPEINLLTKVLQSEAGQVGIKALNAGTEAYASFKKNNPNAAKDIEAVFNIASILPINKTPAKAVEAVKEAGGIAADAATMATRKAPGAIDKELTKAITEGVQKAVRPSVAGKSTSGQAKAYFDKATDAVKRIVENKTALSLTDDAGEKVAGQLPKTLGQFSEAVEQTKKNIFKEYDNLARSAGAAGAEVKLTPIAVELDKVISNKIVADLNPEIAEYALKRQEALWKRKTYTTEEAQDAIAQLNNSLQAYYKNPTYENASKAGVDALIVNNMRKALDDVIEQTTGPGYQQLKRSYGALKSIEKDVVHRAVVDARKNTKGLIDFSDIFSGSALVNGVLSMSPATIASAGAAGGIARFYKYLNDPNRIVKGMFGNVEKLMEKRAKTSASFNPKSQTVRAYKGMNRAGQISSQPKLPGAGVGVTYGLTQFEPPLITSGRMSNNNNALNLAYEDERRRRY